MTGEVEGRNAGKKKKGGSSSIPKKKKMGDAG